jgi:hypothetical protein
MAARGPSAVLACIVLSGCAAPITMRDING